MIWPQCKCSTNDVNGGRRAFGLVTNKPIDNRQPPLNQRSHIITAVGLNLSQPAFSLGLLQTVAALSSRTLWSVRYSCKFWGTLNPVG